MQDSKDLTPKEEPADVEENSEMAELLEKKEKLLQTLQKKQVLIFAMAIDSVTVKNYG